jgi:selenocysteine lyase/cysteine desulfurase
MPTPPPTTEAIHRWRWETPGTDSVIHLNNAGSALPPRAVVDATTEYLAREAELGGYELAAERAGQIDGVYDAVAALVGTAARNIALVENATVAFSQTLLAIELEPGDAIVTSRTDYPSNQIQYLALAERQGVEVIRADDLPEGGIDPQAVREILRRSADGSGPRVRLVAVSWVPTNTGLVQEAAAVGAVCREAGVPYLVDACQAVGQMPVSMDELGCDYLAATGRKFLRAPRGTGFLAVSDRVLDERIYPLTVDLRGAEWTDPDRFELYPGARRFENWEFSYALQMGLGEAARVALDVGLDVARDRARSLADHARTTLGALPGVRVLDPERPAGELAAIATFEIEGHDAQEIVERLRQEKVHTSAFDRSSGVLDMDAKGASTGLRVSPHYYNVAEEVDALGAALGEILR